MKIPDGNPCTFLREKGRNGFSNPGTAAGDDRYLVFQSHVVTPSQLLNEN
jgi:hypothetical protein